MATKVLLVDSDTDRNGPLGRRTLERVGMGDTVHTSTYPGRFVRSTGRSRMFFSFSAFLSFFFPS